MDQKEIDMIQYRIDEINNLIKKYEEMGLPKEKIDKIKNKKETLLNMLNT